MHHCKFLTFLAVVQSDQDMVSGNLERSQFEKDTEIYKLKTINSVVTVNKISCLPAAVGSTTHSYHHI